MVALPPTPTATTWAPPSTVGSISSPVRVGDAAIGSRSSSPTRPSPLARAVSTIAVPPSSSRPKGASISRPSGSWTGAEAVSPPSAVSSTSIVPSPPSAIGQRSVGQPARSRPLVTAAATSVARSVPLKESGATTTGGRGVAEVTRGCCQASGMATREHVMLEIAGHEVRLSNPDKVYFPKPGWTKRDLVDYYLAVGDAAVVHLRDRPTVMKRFVNGIEEDPIWQKRVPKSTPDWLQTAPVSFPSGRIATDLCANAAAHLAWAYSVRPTPDARVSCPLAWDEVADSEPRDLRLDTVPARVRERGDPAADIDDHAGSLDKLLDLAQRDEEQGLGDAPWPPHFAKQTGEPKRVQPSRDRDRPKPGRIGDPQPPGLGGRVPAPERAGSDEHPRRRPGERTGQGYDHEFDSD